MAMLAEIKRKQKWTLNPRGKNWTEDQNKFGQKMLEKMGWTSGKGLGVQEQGITEHIRVKFKDDQTGIGFDKNDYDKKWIENQSGFNDLLAQLQQQNGDTVIIQTDDAKGLSGKSLEIKSEKSRARVHYKKFTRGKDVNKYNPKDLANILGKKDIHEKYTLISEKVEVEDVSIDPVGTTDHRGGVVTIKGGNMNDYFKTKMLSASTMTSKDLHEEKNESESETEQRSGFGFKSFSSTNENNMNINLKENNIGTTDNVTVETVEESSKKKKKKSKKKLQIEEQTDFAFDNPCLLDINKIDDKIDYDKNIETPDTDEQKKKDKKRKKKIKQEDKCNVDCTSNSNQENLENSEIININLDLEQTEVVSNSKKRKEKHAVNSYVETTKDFMEKDNKETKFCFDNPNLMDINEIDKEASKLSKKDKKSMYNKNKSEDVLHNLNESIEIIKDVDSSQNTIKRKKKKSASKKENESDLNDSTVTSQEKGCSENNYTYENPCLMDINKIDCESKSSKKRKFEGEVTDFECEGGKKKKRKKEKKENKEENTFAFENPCLMNVNEIDNENQTKEEQSGKRNKKRRSINENNNDDGAFVFENPCLEDVNKIDEEAEKMKRSKKSKTNKENVSVIEIADNSKNQELEEKNNFAFGNPCLSDVQTIDNEAQIRKKKKKRNSVEGEDIKASDFVDQSKTVNEDKEIEKNIIDTNIENCKGNEFEVPRKHFGLVNNGLDLTDEISGKKRVTFNDKVEFNTDVENNRKGNTKLDKFEVDYVMKRRKFTKGKFVHTKKELMSLFKKNPILNFPGSNINEIRGYGCE